MVILFGSFYHSENSDSDHSPDNPLLTMVLVTMRIYADTSVFGGVFDQEFAVPSQRFFEEIEAGHFTLVTSAIVETEIEPAPKPIQELFRQIVHYAQVVPVEAPALQLQQKYLEAGIVTAKSTDDALHVAIASVSGCD
jgi:predicted nucleic acid-binding protein